MVLGMRHGIVFRSSEALLLANRSKAVAFDKTGTLSEGVLSVVRSTYPAAVASRVTMELVSSSRNPVALAVSRTVGCSSSDIWTENVLTDNEVVPGGGIRATIFGCEVRGGNAAFTGLDKYSLVQEYLAASLTIFAVVRGTDVIAVFGLVNQARQRSRISSLAYVPLAPQPTFFRATIPVRCGVSQQGSESQSPRRMVVFCQPKKRRWFPDSRRNTAT
jgi:Cu2+-exporting ATPase